MTSTEIEIVSELKTKVAIQDFMDSLARLKSNLYLTSDFRAFTAYLDQSFSYDFAVRLKKLLPEGSNNQSSLYDITRLDTLLTALIHDLSLVGFVSVGLAFKPTTQFVGRIFNFVNAATTQVVALDVHYTPDILGGVVLSYNGAYLDFSFAQKLHKINLADIYVS